MFELYTTDVLRIARNEIGYLEKASADRLDEKTANPGKNNYTKYARDLWNALPHFYQGNKQGYEWCCIFVDWCMYVASGMDSTGTQKAKYYTGPYGAGCQYAASYYKAADAWYSTPKVGDQIFFGYGNDIEHTGIVENIVNGTVYTIEGNSSNSVEAKHYSINDSYIVGYGRPNYTAFARCDIPFVDVPSDAWYRKAVEWAYQNGITTGTDSSHFSPGRNITRAEVVQMLYKALGQ